jgi:hypothetical protein
VDEARGMHLLDGINTVTGDQENVEVLKGWLQTTGGNFDIIVDDGRRNKYSVLFRRYIP